MFLFGVGGTADTFDKDLPVMEQIAGFVQGSAIDDDRIWLVGREPCLAVKKVFAVIYLMFFATHMIAEPIITAVKLFTKC